LKIINMKNLNFFSSDQNFEAERKKIFRQAVSIGSILCTILVPLFSILDMIFKPHQFETFLLIRLTVVLTCILIFFINKKSHGRKHPFLLASIMAVVVCGSISLMCFIDLGPSDPYYAGINLPLLGFGIMLPLTMSESIIVFIFVWLSYFLPNMTILQPEEIGIFANNNFFLISTIIISLISTQYNFKYTKRQWISQKKLRAAQDEIKKHADELEKKVKERTQKLLQSERLAVVGQLAGGISHDFNNILTGILGTTSLLLKSTSKKNPIRKEIECINQLSLRAADLVKQLLLFSRRQVLKSKIINVNDIIRNVGKMLHRVLREDIELMIITQPEVGYIYSDPIQIEQIILNLSINARDAMPHGGMLIIETANVTLDDSYCRIGKVSLAPGDYVMISVSDTGVGMNDEVKSKMFDPFFTTKEVGKGTGLGLSTVYGIVKQSKGDIVVYSEEGKGTTIKILLPRIMERKSPKQDRPKEIKTTGGKETILLVEDEEKIRNVTARMLEKQGYKVILAEEGREAINICKQYNGNIDLLVTDIVMPYMSGKELAKKLVAKRSNLKVLFISGYFNNIESEAFMIKSNYKFLQKPYTFQTLHSTIRNIFDN